MKPTWTKRYVDRPGYPADPAVVEIEIVIPKYECKFELGIFKFHNDCLHLNVALCHNDIGQEYFVCCACHQLLTFPVEKAVIE